MNGQSVSPTTVPIQGTSTKKPRFQWGNWGQVGAFIFILISGVAVILYLFPEYNWFAKEKIIERHIVAPLVNFASRYIFVPSRIRASNSSLDGTVYLVNKAVLRKPGYIVLFFGPEFEAGSRDPLGVSRYLLPGRYANVPLLLVSDRISELGPMLGSSNASLVIAIVEDNGDAIFNVQDPARLKDDFAKDLLGQYLFVKLTL